MDASQEQFSQYQQLPTAADGTQPPATAVSGSEPLPSDGIRSRPQPTARIRTVDHIVTAEEVVALLRKAGVPRSIRRVTEYCQRGDLDAFRDPDERRWYVTPASVTELITHFQELRSRHTTTADIRTVPPLTAANGTPPPATAGDGNLRKPTAGSDPLARTTDLPSNAAEKIKQLEDEVTGLKISNQAKDIVIGQLKEERTSFIQLLQKRAFTIGRLKTKLLQLQAPTSSEHRIAGSVHEASPAAPQPDTSPVPPPSYRTAFADVHAPNTKEQV
jgi:hypothetical protein